MTNINNIQLHEYDELDIFDVVIKLEKTFAVSFDKNAFADVKTLGDLCDVIESYIKYDHKEDCTKQQAFYKIRTAISDTQFIQKRQITPGSQLADIFPKQNRKQRVKKFQKQLGVNLNLLTYPSWLQISLLTVLLTSFVAFFFDWKIAVSGIVFYLITNYIGGKSGKTLTVETVKDLTEKAALYHYVYMRSTKSTVNRKEILNVIKDAFSNELDLNKEHLKSDTKFSWA